ncbi:MAG: hypothetical protein WC415_06600 [Patescibacteria group bacterium]|jgi:hypothetical protein
MMEINKNLVRVTAIEKRTFVCDIYFSDYERITPELIKSTLKEELFEYPEIFDVENIIDEDWEVTDVDILGEVQE